MQIGLSKSDFRLKAFSLTTDKAMIGKVLAKSKKNALVTMSINSAISEEQVNLLTNTTDDMVIERSGYERHNDVFAAIGTGLNIS